MISAVTHYHGCDTSCCACRHSLDRKYLEEEFDSSRCSFCDFQCRNCLVRALACACMSPASEHEPRPQLLALAPFPSLSPQDDLGMTLSNDLVACMHAGAEAPPQGLPPAPIF